MQWSVEIRDVGTSDFPDLDGVLSLLGEPLLGFAGADRGLLERRESKMLNELHSMFYLQPGVAQELPAAQPLGRLHSEQLLDEIERLPGDLLGLGGEHVVGSEDLLTEAAAGLPLLREGFLPKEKLIEDNTESPHVHLLGVLLTTPGCLQDLGGQVSPSAAEGFEHSLIYKLTQAEVRDLDDWIVLIFRTDQDIFQFQIAVANLP